MSEITQNQEQEQTTNQNNNSVERQQLMQIQDDQEIQGEIIQQQRLNQNPSAERQISQQNIMPKEYQVQEQQQHKQEFKEQNKIDNVYENDELEEKQQGQMMQQDIKQEGLEEEEEVEGEEEDELQREENEEDQEGNENLQMEEEEEDEDALDEDEEDGVDDEDDDEDNPNSIDVEEEQKVDNSIDQSQIQQLLKSVQQQHQTKIEEPNTVSGERFTNQQPQQLDKKGAQEPGNNNTQYNQMMNHKLNNLIESYSLFINDTTNIVLDLDLVLYKMNSSIKSLKPPPNSSEKMQDLWKYLLEVDKKSIDELSQRFSQLNGNLLYESVQQIEKLYIKLMLEYNIEVNRGKQLGIIKNEQ